MTTQRRSEMIDDMTTFNEQLRKTAETVTQQARQSMSTAQEQLKQSLTDAQQAQSDMARMLVRLNEQNGQIVTTTLASLWDASLSLLKLTTWQQEQTEYTVRQLLDRGAQVREEGAGILRDAAEQARQHQAELCRLAQESLRVGLFYAGKTVRNEPEGIR